MGKTTGNRLSDPPSLVSVKRAAQMLGTEPATVAELCELGDLPSGRMGERIVIPAAAVNAYAFRILEAS